MEKREDQYLELVEEEEEEEEPVSPTGQYFNSSALSVSILAVFESEVPIDDSPAIETLENLFLPISPRFSSIMVKDEHGNRKWKKVEVKLKDHVKIPVFPPGLPSYDDYVQDYLSDVALRELPQSRPLWDLHIIKYPTRSSGAAGTMVFKLHHALGDGYSLMGALFSCLRRAEDPSLPLTFPTSSSAAAAGDGGWWLTRVLAVCANTVRDFGWSFWKSNLAEDDVTPVRSGMAGTEFRPITMSSVAFSIEEIRKVTDKLGGTINDVICGVIFYGIRLYIDQVMNSDDQNKYKKKKKKEEEEESISSEVTALVLLNTRMIANLYQHPQAQAQARAQAQPNSKHTTSTSWGNQFGFLHVSVPKCENLKEEDPLEFVFKAKKIIKAKRTSLAVYLTGRLLEFIRKVKGPEVTAKYIHGTLRNTSLSISNLIGPKEQMIIAGHPVRTFHFMVVGIPQSLTITMVSYMGKLKVTFGAEKGFIDSQLLISSMRDSFRKIYQAAAEF